MKNSFIKTKDYPPPKNTNILAVDKEGGVANVYWSDDNNEWAFETFDIWYIAFPDEIVLWQLIDFPINE